jgi:hypothetical protein
LGWAKAGVATLATTAATAMPAARVNLRNFKLINVSFRK